MPPRTTTIVVKSKTRGKGFRADEIDSEFMEKLIALPSNAHFILYQRLLDRIEQTLPMGAQQWEALALDYNRNLPANWSARDWESLRGKFYALKNVRKPTGDQPFDPIIA